MVLGLKKEVMTSAELYEYGETSLAMNEPVARKLIRNFTCPVHKRKALAKFDYCNDGTHAYITRYCCKAHAEIVAQALIEAELFDFVTIE